MTVAEKRKRWIVNAFLIFSLLAFIGFSIAPLLGGLSRREYGPSVAASASTDTALNGEQQSLLESQAQGYELVLQREPNNETALRGLLETRLEMGDIAGAIEPLEKLSQLKPEQPEYSILLAQAKQQANDREGAAQAYRSILANQPGNLGALQGLVGLLLDQERPEAAIGLLQDTLELADQANQIQPDSIDTPAVQLILGQVYAEQQRYDEAIAVYDSLHLVDDQDFRPLVAKAIVLKAQGKPDEAQPLFEEAAGLAPAQYKDQINQLAQENATTSSDAPSTATDANVDTVAPTSTDEP